MEFGHYTDEPVSMAVDLVNTFGEFGREENLKSTEDLAAFLDEYAEHRPETSGRIRDKDLEEIRALRARLRVVFAAKDEESAADQLNEILADAAAVPRVSVHARARPHLHFEPIGGSPAKWLAAVTAMGLSIVLVEDGLDRFGICGSAKCDDVFVDTSRNRSRRYCSDTCTTRVNVAAYRERQKAR